MNFDRTALHKYETYHRKVNNLRNRFVSGLKSALASYSRNFDVELLQDNETVVVSFLDIYVQYKLILSNSDSSLLKLVIEDHRDNAGTYEFTFNEFDKYVEFIPPGRPGTRFDFKNFAAGVVIPELDSLYVKDSESLRSAV